MLLDLSKAEIRALGLHLGLRYSTLNNYASCGEEYLYNMVVSWINGKDNVLAEGGATWECLKQAMLKERLYGHAQRI